MRLAVRALIVLGLMKQRLASSSVPWDAPPPVSPDFPLQDATCMQRLRAKRGVWPLHGADLRVIEHCSVLCRVSRGRVHAFCACGSCNCLRQPGSRCLQPQLRKVSSHASTAVGGQCFGCSDASHGPNKRQSFVKSLGCIIRVGFTFHLYSRALRRLSRSKLLSCPRMAHNGCRLPIARARPPHFWRMKNTSSTIDVVSASALHSSIAIAFSTFSSK